MATIVQHIESGGHCILLSAAYTAFKSHRPTGQLFGYRFSKEDSGEIFVAAVADAEGEISWGRTRDFRVVSVDGSTPAEVLAQFG